MKSWIEIPANSDFSLANIPFGICSFPSSCTSGTSQLSPSTPRCCTAIGNYAIDLHLLAEAGLLDNLVTSCQNNSHSSDSDDEKLHEIITNFHPRIVFAQSTLNEFMSCEKYIWVAVRNRLIQLFMDSNDTNNNNLCTTLQLQPDNRLQQNTHLQSHALHPLSTAIYHLPATIGDYTDFYSSREHATNVGIMFRGRENALQPNWLCLPVGYHGRSSSVFPSLSSGDNDYGSHERMSTVRRPCGQLQVDPLDAKKGSVYGPCKLMDFELEVAFFVGGPTNTANDCNNHHKQQQQQYGRPLTITEAQDRIFGYVLMNDWSARDIQKWEYVPLGPFTSKNFATTISTWVVTCMALEPFRCESSAGVQGDDIVDGGEPVPLDYLKDPNYGSYDVNLTVSIQPSNTSTTTQICNSNLKHMYWSSAQQLVHHSVTGCPMNAGDLLASGTISGTEQHNFGSMLELSWKGSREIALEDGQVRKFLKDGDAVIMKGWCEREGIGRVGFGQCSGRILPAIPFPYESSKGEVEEDVTRMQPNERYTNFVLEGYRGSPSSWQVCIALAAKDISYEYIESSDESSLLTAPSQDALLKFEEDGKPVTISKSHAIIDFLEAAFDHRGGRLLPLEPMARAKVIEFAEAIDTCLRPQRNEITRDGGDDSGEDLVRETFLRGLSSLEELASTKCAAGPFVTGSFGPTLADAHLAPLLYHARRLGFDLNKLYPTLAAIESNYNDHPWFQKAQARAL